jgi:lipid-binding SYLF domain-containing protein
MILLMAWTDGDRETAPGALAGSDVAASLEGTETAAGLPARNETSSSRTPRDRYGGSGGSATGAGTEVLPSKLAERAANAATVLDEVLGVAEGIPASLLRKAECVAVIPGVIKVGFGIGGRHGRGLLSCRTDGGWSLPAFVSLTGGSFGLQIGAQASDLVLVFADRGAAERLASNKITLGGDASVSAGPVGRTAEAGTDVRFQAEIYSYSRSKGLFAGMSLEGATLRADDDANRDAYDADRRPADLLIVSATPRARELARFVSRLESVGY